MNLVPNQIGETQVDRIGTLPDDIICHNILSLIPTKDSVRTSSLSTRWKHLYASVPVLDFESCDKNFPAVFVKVLNTVKEKRTRISKLRLHLARVSVDLSSLEPWIDYFTSHSIQKLDLRIFGIDHMPTPHCLFTCETLLSLSLGVEFVLSVPDIVCLPKLRSLSLENIILRDETDDKSISRLFSSCPVLENLTVLFSDMPNARVLDVCVPSLKALNLFHCFNDTELIINCPNLEELNCEFNASRGYSGNVLGALKKCDIQVYFPIKKPKEGNLIELIRLISKVEVLSLHRSSMEVLLTPSCSLPSFENLTHLELVSSGGWELLPSILESSPRLETLVFKNGFYGKYDTFDNPFPPPEHIPACLCFHLRVIRIGRFRGKKEEYKWVEYFVTNALVLEKIEISLCLRPSPKKANDPCVEDEEEGKEEVQCQSRLEEMSRRLLNFQRSSIICQIIIILPSFY